MNMDFAINLIAYALMAILVGGYIIRMHRKERKESVEILGKMKTQFLPQLKENLEEIHTKLENSEGEEYTSLLTRGLSATLTIELRLRFDKVSRKMDHLNESLGSYEAEVAQASQNPQDHVPAKLMAHNAGLKRMVEELILDIQALSRLDRLPAKQMAIGRQ